MHLLYYKRNSIMSTALERTFEQLGFEVDTVASEAAYSEWDENNALDALLRKRLSNTGYDAAFSLNFNPQVSEFCEKKGICYISWINDSPLYIRNEEVMKRSCNHLFMFDRGYVEEYRRRGMPFYHMPLAVDTELFNKACANCSAAETARFSTDIAMVGSLYSTKYDGLIRPLSSDVVSLLEQMIHIQQKIENRSIFPEVLTDAFLKQINQEYENAGIDFTVDREGLEFLLLTEVTGRDRKLIPSLLAKHYDVHVYSKDTLPLPGVHMEPPVDYLTQMPVIFRHAGININTTLRTIRTGIPLRALDILGCGGFLATNAQEEILEHFEPDKELIVYHSVEELYDKVKWYMDHASKRHRIAKAGLARVKQEFAFTGQLNKIFQTCSLRI